MRRLSFAEVGEARWEVEGRSPYDPSLRRLAASRVEDPSSGTSRLMRGRKRAIPALLPDPMFLALTPENFSGSQQVQLYQYGLRSKDYALYRLIPPGPIAAVIDGRAELLAPTPEEVRALTEVIIVKASEHALGYLTDPLRPGVAGKAFISEIYRYLIRRHHGVHAAEPAFADAAAISMRVISHPSMVSTSSRRTRTMTWPFSTFVQAHVADRGILTQKDRSRTIVAVYEAGMSTPTRWLDGKAYGLIRRRIITETVAQRDGVERYADGPIVIEDMRGVTDRHENRSDRKMSAPGVLPSGEDDFHQVQTRKAHAADVIIIGKEHRVVPGTPFGVAAEDEAQYSIYRDPRRDSVVAKSRVILKRWPSKARRWGTQYSLPLPTLKRFLHGGKPSRKTREKVIQIAADIASAAMLQLAPRTVLPRDAEGIIFSYASKRIPPTKCEGCRVLIEHPKRRWCSRECARSTRRFGDGNPKRESRLCKGCGRPLLGKQRSWCSRCRQKSGPQRARSKALDHRSDRLTPSCY